MVQSHTEQAASGPRSPTIEVVKYLTPLVVRGFDYMAFNNDPDDDRAIYGFGATEDEAIADFRRQSAED